MVVRYKSDHISSGLEFIDYGKRQSQGLPTEIA
jgi:hypothetical protein